MKLIDGWNRLWFEEIPAGQTALMRMSLGLLVGWWLIDLWPEIDLWFVDGPMDHEALAEGWTPWRWSPLDHVGQSGARAWFGLTVALAAAFGAGFRSRVTGLLLFLLLAGIWHRAPFIQNGGDRLLRIAVLYMALVPGGRAWSVDGWWASRRGLVVPATVPALGVRLVQLQLVVMYTYTGVAKLGGSAWRELQALYFALSSANFSRAPALFDPLLDHLPVQWALSLASLATLVFELGFLPLVAWRRTRALTLVVGLLLHLGIFLTMSVGVFSWASLWGYQAFLPDAWRAVLERPWPAIRGGAR